MYANENAGRYDHLHGDEDWTEPRPVTSDDVLETIAHERQYYLDWVKQIEETDAFFDILLIIAKNRNKPEYAELVSKLKYEIEGFL
jgi:hypothetical protein